MRLQEIYFVLTKLLRLIILYSCLIGDLYKGQSEDAKLARHFFYAQLQLLYYIHWSGSSTRCLKRTINLKHHINMK